MKWILSILLLLPLHLSAGVISYGFTDSAVKIFPEHERFGRPISIAFSYLPGTEIWLDMTVEFLGDTWLPVVGGPTQLEIVSTEIEHDMPTYWIAWTPILTNGETTLSIMTAEWKLYHDGTLADPFSNLDQSFIGSGLITTDDNAKYAFGGRFAKVFDVPEPLPVALLAFGLIAIGLRSRFR